MQLVHPRTSVIVGLLLAALLPAAALARTDPRVRLYGYPCAGQCRATLTYRPRIFRVGSHYWFTSVRWLSWNDFTASATVTLHAEFAGMAHPIVDRTVIIFEQVKTLCGLRTYTRWVSGDGNAQDFERAAGTNSCRWYVGAP